MFITKSFTACLALSFVFASGACQSASRDPRSSLVSDAAAAGMTGFGQGGQVAMGGAGTGLLIDAGTKLSPDAAPPVTHMSADAAAPDGASTDACANAVCETFESAMLDAQRWEVVMPMCTGTAQVDIDAQQHHSGAHSLRVQGLAGYCNHVFVRPRAPTFAPSDPLYVRFYVRLAEAIGQGHVSWLALHDEVAGKDLRLGGQVGVMIWNRESDDATLPELSPAGMALSTAPQPGVWSCVEFLIDARGSTLQTWVDGKAIVGLSSDGTPTQDADAQWQRQVSWHPQLSDVRFGYESYGGDAATVWYDDIVIAKQRVGCLPQ